jgi:hypothetical protein
MKSGIAKKKNTSVSSNKKRPQMKTTRRPLPEENFPEITLELGCSETIKSENL